MPLGNYFSLPVFLAGLAALCACAAFDKLTESDAFVSEYLMECEIVSNGINRYVNDEVICYKLFEDGISCLRNEKR